jgi:diketogulonate reductase-like aldo/keto reductase
MITRRECLSNLALLGIGGSLQGWEFMQDPIKTRPIPSTLEQLPVVGVGTWQTFDVGSSDSERAPLKEVLTQLVNNGGKVIDSSPMYGRSEQVAGDLSTDAGVNAKLFIATKVWTSGKENGIEQMKRSFDLLRRKQMDLMQIHNLLDWQTHIKTLRDFVEKGTIRYIGLTHYTDSSHDTIISIIRDNPVDFIQVNYNILDTHAEERLLPFAAERKVAVIINRPFQEGSLFQNVRGKKLPEWAGEFDCKSWAQFFLKFILSNPHVTCTIPGTDKLTHLIDNLAAGRGRLPDEKMRKRMVEELR